MRTSEIIKALPTSFKQTTTNPLHTGHYMPLLGYWTKAEGYVKRVSLNWEGESLACPIVAVVNQRVGKEDVTLTITAKVSQYSSTEEKQQFDYTVKKKKYVPTETTISTTLKIPRFTRQWATFLLTGLGKECYEITSVTDDANYDTSKIEFYALASAGAKIIYWLGLHQVEETLRDILQGFWIAPTKCYRCGATGIEPGTSDDACKQCNGYKYSGYNSTRYIQRMKGFDVGLARRVLDWDNMTEEDHTLVREFINKAWTQKWWVTPTKSEIKRLFSHFLGLNEDDIIIEERFDLQEPVWRLSLPRRAGISSPFNIDIYSTQESLLKYIARSITPAGVSVFVGFYDLGFFGEFDFSTSLPHSISLKDSAFDCGLHKLFNTARLSFHNGWTYALDHFERCTGNPTGEVGGIWASTGQVDLYDVNDQNRHVVRFIDNSYIEHSIAGVPTGKFELWVHPQDTEMRFLLVDNGGDCGYVKYDPQLTGFYNNNNILLRSAMPHCDYHIRIDFVVDATGYGSTGQYGYVSQVQIDREVVSNGFEFIKTVSTNPRVRFQNIGSGSGFIDAYGNDWMAGNSGYNAIGDNYQRLHKNGWGICNSLDYFDYVKNDKFWEKL